MRKSVSGPRPRACLEHFLTFHLGRVDRARRDYDDAVDDLDDAAWYEKPFKVGRLLLHFG